MTQAEQGLLETAAATSPETNNSSGDQDDPWTNEEVKQALSSTIVYDDDTKLLVFYGSLLNYTNQDQLNMSLGGETCVGKSHIALEVIKYHPKSRVKILGYCSPKSFFHEMGVLVDADGQIIPTLNAYIKNEIIDWTRLNQKSKKGEGLKEWRERRTEARRQIKDDYEELDKLYLVDLHQIILVFVDMPHDELLQRLRAFLSHDQKEIEIKIVDRKATGGNRTKTVILRGYPTIIYCMAPPMGDEQERSRVMLLSPSADQNKLRESIKMLGKRLRDNYQFEQDLKNDAKRQNLIKRVEDIANQGIRNIIISKELMEDLTNKFLERQTLIPRNQRDFPRLVALAKANALLNYDNRKHIGWNIYAKKADIDTALELYKPIEESNELGLRPETYQIYLDIIKDQTKNPTKRSELQERYFKHYKRSISYDRLVEILAALSAAGIVAEVPGTDKRYKYIQEIYTPEGGVENSPPSENEDEEEYTPEQSHFGVPKSKGGKNHPPPHDPYICSWPGCKLPLNEETGNYETKHGDQLCRQHFVAWKKIQEAS